MKFFLWDLAEHPAKVELFLLTLTQQQYTRVKAEHCDAASCTVNFRNHALASRWGRKKKQKVKKCWEKLEHPLRWGNMSICIICILLLSFYILFSSSCFSYPKQGNAPPHSPSFPTAVYQPGLPGQMSCPWLERDSRKWSCKLNSGWVLKVETLVTKRALIYRSPIDVG